MPDNPGPYPDLESQLAEEDFFVWVVNNRDRLHFDPPDLIDKLIADYDALRTSQKATSAAENQLAEAQRRYDQSRRRAGEQDAASAKSDSDEADSPD